MFGVRINDEAQTAATPADKSKSVAYDDKELVETNVESVVVCSLHKTLRFA